jgi:SAM-dependent methyltransferase
MVKAVSVVPDQRVFWDGWHERHTEASHTDHSRAALRIFVDAFGEMSGVRVLEIGCGQGREAIKLASSGFTVNAFDHSAVAISSAMSNASRANVGVAFVEHDMTEHFPYSPETFAGVFAHLSIHYFDEMTTRSILREIKKVLAPKGILFFTARSVHDSLYGAGDRLTDNMFCLNGHVRHFFDMDFVQKLLADWDIRQMEYYDTCNQTVNPGVFIKVLAARSARSGL